MEELLRQIFETNVYEGYKVSLFNFATSKWISSVDVISVQDGYIHYSYELENKDASTIVEVIRVTDLQNITDVAFTKKNRAGIEGIIDSLNNLWIKEEDDLKD